MGGKYQSKYVELWFSDLEEAVMPLDAGYEFGWICCLTEFLCSILEWFYCESDVMSL